MSWLGRLIGRLVARLFRTDTPVCEGCARPLASEITDRTMWRAHVSQRNGAYHAIEACDGTSEHRTVMVRCKYDEYSSSGEGDW